MRKVILALAALGLVVCLQATPAHAQASRTWVSGVGDDANPCSRTAPCKTFAGAISKTAAGGEIDCLDPGGFGAVTIIKSITLDCGATLGSILVAGTNGINVNGAGINVVLRNLSINGIGSGLIGINFTAGNSLIMENVTVMNFNAGSAIGVQFAPNSANAVLLVNRSTIFSNGLSPSTGGGIVVNPAANGNNALVTVYNSKIQRNGGTGVAATSTNGGINMTLRDSEISNNTNGGVSSTAGNSLTVMLDRMTINSNSGSGILSSGAASTVRVNNSTIAANAVAVTGTVFSFKNNAVGGNGGGEGPYSPATPQ